MDSTFCPLGNIHVIYHLNFQLQIFGDFSSKLVNIWNSLMTTAEDFASLGMSIDRQIDNRPTVVVMVVLCRAVCRRRDASLTTPQHTAALPHCITHSHSSTTTYIPDIITDRISTAGNAIASIHLSVRPSVSTLLFKPTDL